MSEVDYEHDRRKPRQRDDEILLTVFLKHQKDKNLAQINERLEATGFFDAFPPEGIEVYSWQVLMGIGQVVTLAVPARRLREVNLAIERCAWGAFDTEFYPTYDFMPVWRERVRRRSHERKSDD